MNGDGGHWAPVLLPGEPYRHDWIPDEQPPSPDGSDGEWHLVGEPGGEGRWEWYPTGSAVRAPAAPFVPIGGTPDPRRVALFLGLVAAVLLALFLVVTHGDGADDSTGRTAGTDGGTNTSAGSSAGSSAGVSSATQPSLTFPMTAGDWSLGGFQVAKDPRSGVFTGTAWVYYIGSDPAGASTPFRIEVVEGGRVAGALTGTARDVRPGTFRTVALDSSSPWIEDPDGFTFTPAAR